MADWLGNRSEAGFDFRVVDWETWQEVGEWPYATGGSIELSALSDTKQSGTVTFEGQPPDPRALLRAYYSFVDDDGERVEVPVATMRVRVSATDERMSCVLGDDGVEVEEAVYSGKAHLDSVLTVLKGKKYGAPFTIPAGTDAVRKAAELVESLGLRAAYPQDADYVTASGHTFSAEDANYLGIVNWLLGAAGYSSAWVDAYGTVQLAPYEEPTSREPVFAFSPGAESVMLPEVPYRNDYASTPNVVRLCYQTEEECLTAYAANVDPEHSASLPNSGGIENTLYLAVTELAGETADERLALLVEAAARKLLDNSAEIEYVEIGCPFLPLLPNDSITAALSGGEWRGSATNYSFPLGTGADGKLTARRFVRDSLEIESGGERVW